jgi:RNA polymerase sigma-70 factor (ECF subfamily)
MMQAGTQERIVADEILVDRARQGGHRAFEVLVARYQDRVHRLAMRMSRNRSDAEEISQETFLRAHCGIRSLEARARFRTWLYRIAINEALMRKRAEGRRPTQSLETLFPRLEEVRHAMPCDANPWSSTEDLLERKQLAARVRDALKELDEPLRAVLVLRDLEELSAEEAAEILGITPGALRQRAHRARLKLREHLFRKASRMRDQPIQALHTGGHARIEV